MREGARLRIARVIAVASGLALVVGVIVLLVRDGDSTAGALADALREARPATPAWSGWTETNIGVGPACRRVLVADDQTERVQGLRQVSDLAPYDGMLFVQTRDTRVAFTMSGVPDALDITWYDARGRPVDSTTMTPCPGTDATCPTYSSKEPFRYTLERRGGEAEPGVLGSC